MNVSWTAPAFDGGAAITSYVVTDSTDTVRCTSASTSCTATGLTVGSSHRLKVHAVNVAGAGAPTALSSSVLQLGPPANPAAAKIVSGRYQLLLSWSAPDNRGFEILQYNVTATFGSETYSCTTSSTRCILTGFPSSKRTYRVVLTATNVYSTSGESPEVLFATWYTPAPSSSSDLTDFQFNGLDLSSANISGANLAGANFSGLNLTGADLSGATLTGLRSGAVVGTPTLPSG